VHAAEVAPLRRFPGDPLWYEGRLHAFLGDPFRFLSWGILSEGAGELKHDAFANNKITKNHFSQSVQKKPIALKTLMFFLTAQADSLSGRGMLFGFSRDAQAWRPMDGPPAVDTSCRPEYVPA
jgi:hypothetical protein